MTWFKVDDQLHDHRKPRSAGKSAMGVWVLAGSWSMDNLTDGFVPEGVLTRWGSKGDATRLVEAGLWKRDAHQGERGWRFRDWSDYQPSAAVTAAKKAKEAEAGRRGNHQRWHVDRGLSDPECEYCFRVPDQEPDEEPDTSPESGGESGANRPVPVPDPVPQSDPYGSVGSTSPADDRFDEFWETYGKKVDRKAAEQKWKLALKKPGVTADVLIACAAAYVLYERTENEGGRFIMGPAKWLLNERWTDERPARPAPQTNMQAHMRLVEQMAEVEGVASPFRAIGGA